MYLARFGRFISATYLHLRRPRAGKANQFEQCISGLIVSSLPFQVILEAPRQNSVDSAFHMR